MNFSELKDVNKVKALAKQVGSDIKAGFKGIKINKETFNKFFVSYLKNDYLKFDGRVSRQQYWMFSLFSMLIGIVLNICVNIVSFLAILSVVYCLGLLLPSFSLIIRRLHDVNLSGWWLFIALIPVLGGLVLLILFCLPSDSKANNFGEAVK